MASNRIMKFVFIGLFSFLATISFGQQPQDVVLYDQAGNTLDFKELTSDGSSKVVVFWATYCGGCKMELAAFERLVPKWKTKFNAEVVIVALDGPTKVAKVNSLIQENNWGSYTSLYDSGLKAYRSLQAQAIPYTLVFDGNGYLIKRFNGYEYGLENEIHNILFKLNKVSK